MTSVLLLDVGHGNCTIVRSGASTAVVDCPTGAMLLDTFDDLGIDTVETAIISHADKDHIAGILSLLTSDRLRVERIFVNPDSQKKSRIWRDFRVAVAVAEREQSCQVVTSLSSTTPGTIAVGDVEISVLGPSAALALTGVGGKSPVAGKTVTSNTLSGLLRIAMDGAGAMLLAADMDEVSLDEAIAAGTDLSADVLIFPHHGGLPGNAEPRSFTKRLLQAVNPHSVVFSNGRGRHDAPRPEIIGSVLEQGCAIACTQLSDRCHPTTADAGPFLEALRANGRYRGASCAGSMSFELSPAATRSSDAIQRHQTFIAERVATPMCRASISTPSVTDR